MEQQQVQVTVRQQGGQELQELFETPVLSSFVDHKLEQLYGPGALRLEGSNALLAATRALQPAERYIYIVSAAAAGGADVEVRAELVHLSIEGGGAPFSMDCPLYKRKLQVVAIEKLLAAKRLSLLGINGNVPTADEKGYTVETYEPGSTVTITAEPRADDSFKEGDLQEKQEGDLQEKRKQRYWSGFLSVFTVLMTTFLTAVVTRLMQRVAV